MRELVVRSALLLTCVVCVSGCVSTPLSASPPLEEAAARGTLDWFAPKAALTSLRFVYAIDGRCYMELSNPQRMVDRDLCARYPDETDPDGAGLWASHGVPGKRMQRRLASRIPEDVGDTYCLYYPDTHEVKMRRIEAIGFRPTGDGWFSGLWARLDGTPSRQPEEAFEYRPVALAFASGVAARAKDLTPPMPRVTLDQDRLRALLQPSVEIYRERIEAFSLVGGMYIDYPETTGLLVRAKGDDTEWFACLWHDGDTWEPAVFYPWEMPLEQTEGGEACGLPNDTKLFLLPDLDGDGSNEVLVWTTTTRLYRLQEWHDRAEDGTWEKAYRLVEVARTYFGP